MSTIKMSVAEITDFLRREFPQIDIDSGIYVVNEIAPRAATMTLHARDQHLRPGNTVSGPAMMTLADLVMYVAVLGAIGPVALAVTTNLSINFLRKPSAGALVARCRLLKLGRRLAVGDIGLFSDGIEDMVAHVTATYSIPDQG